MAINKKDIKTGFAWMNCKVGCNKQTKHIFLNTKPDELLLACYECILTSDLKKYVNQLNNTTGG